MQKTGIGQEEVILSGDDLWNETWRIGRLPCEDLVKRQVQRLRDGENLSKGYVYRLVRRRLVGERSERLSGVRPRVGLEKWLDFIAGVMWLSLQYLIYFLKESIQATEWKTSWRESKSKIFRRKGIIVLVRAENENCLYFVMGWGIQGRGWLFLRQSWTGLTGGLTMGNEGKRDWRMTPSRNYFLTVSGWLYMGRGLSRVLFVDVCSVHIRLDNEVDRLGR